MKQHNCILIIAMIAVLGCNHPRPNHAVVGKSTVTSAMIKTPAGVLNDEKKLDSLADVMMQSVDNYAETGSVAAEQNFITKFISVLKNTETLRYNFPSLKKYNISLLVSADSGLRIFSWQSPYSGSMWHIQNIMQFSDSIQNITVNSFNNLYAQKDDGTGPTPLFEKAYKLNNKGKAAYLLTGYGQMSGTEPYTLAHFVTINNGAFNINKKVFLINGKPENEIYISATLTENKDLQTLRNELSIKFDSTQKVVTYPIIKDKSGAPVLTGATIHLKYQDGVFR